MVRDSGGVLHVRGVHGRIWEHVLEYATLARPLGYTIREQVYKIIPQDKKKHLHLAAANALESLMNTGLSSLPQSLRVQIEHWVYR